MKEINCDVAILGGGPAGLAAAAAARQGGAEEVVLIERDRALGGILQQCIHPGFGLDYFDEELTGPEYAGRFIKLVKDLKVSTRLNTMALEIRDEGLVCVNPEGLWQLKASATVLAMGCRERTRGNLAIPGARPAGIYTAGSAQRLLNIDGRLVGREIVILGSGDIGMIMARRLTLEGARVKAVVEIMPYLAGLNRNRVQCLDDFGVPLFLSHTVVDIDGHDRVERVSVAPVDEERRPLMDKAWALDCDTLLLSVGLIPENELSLAGGLELSPLTKGPVVNQFMQTRRPDFFACGNVLHVNDLVDNVSREGQAAGRAAALYAAGQLRPLREIPALAGEGVRYVSPGFICPNGSEAAQLFFRVQKPMKDTLLSAESQGQILARRKCLAVSPGEMESLALETESLSGLTEPVTVQAREVEHD